METLKLPVELLDLISQKAEEKGMSITDLLHSLISEEDQKSELDKQILIAQTHY